MWLSRPSAKYRGGNPTTKFRALPFARLLHFYGQDWSVSVSLGGAAIPGFADEADRVLASVDAATLIGSLGHQCPYFKLKFRLEWRQC
jgi:hypothetical protein